MACETLLRLIETARQLRQGEEMRMPRPSPRLALIDVTWATPSQDLRPAPTGWDELENVR